MKSRHTLFLLLVGLIAAAVLVRHRVRRTPVGQPAPAVAPKCNAVNDWQRSLPRDAHTDYRRADPAGPRTPGRLPDPTQPPRPLGGNP